MTSSGTTTFDLNVDDIIDESYEIEDFIYGKLKIKNSFLQVV